jgi:hypothetical protein
VVVFSGFAERTGSFASGCGRKPVATHYGCDRREVRRAGGVEQGRDFAEKVGAEDAGVTTASALAQALNYLLGQLERLGYLERRPDPDDLRSKRVVLTRRGISAISVIRDAVGEIETVWAQQLGAKRFAQLRTLLLDLSQPT